MAIGAILAILSTSALQTVSASINLNQAVSILQSQIEMARQAAQTLNRPVQLRLYTDASSPGKSPSINMMQAVVPSENPSSAQPDQAVEKLIRLPQNIIIADAADLSIPASTSTFFPAPPAEASPSPAYVLTFFTSGAVTAPDGSVPTTGAYWTVSLVPQNLYRSQGGMTQLKNYATFYINSLNSTFSIVRP